MHCSSQTPAAEAAAALSPVAAAELAIRIAYFAHLVIEQSQESLGALVYDLRTFPGAPKSLFNVSDLLFSKAVKEMACVMTYLTILEQGGEQTAPWTKEFLGSVFKMIDRLVAGDPVREIMIGYSMCRGYDVCLEAAESVSRYLSCQLLCERTGALLQSGAADRLRLFNKALTYPIAAINQELAAQYGA